MDLKNFKELKKLSKGISIIYVDEDKGFQKTIIKILEKTFDHVYQAFSVTQALQLFRQLGPDIVLTSMSFSEKSGLEMITEMKHLDQKTKFLVLNELNEDLDLLYQLDLGVSEVLIKPSSNRQLLNALFKTLKSFDNTFFEKCVGDIYNYSKNSNWFYVINLYKGVLVKNKGVVVSIGEDEIKLKINHLQTASAKYQGYSFFILDGIGYLKAFLLSADKTDNTVTYVKPSFLKNIPYEITHKMIQTDRDFVVFLKKNNQNYKLKSLEISSNMVNIFSQELMETINVNDEVDITLGFNTKRINNIIDDFIFNKIFGKGKIVSIEPYKRGILIKAKIVLKNKDIKILEKYINEQEENRLFELTKFR